MKVKVKDGIALVRMGSGEDYIRTIKEACMMLPGTGATVVSSIGQFTKVSLGFFRGDGDYHPLVIERPLELLNVSGLVSKGPDGPIPHLHAIVGDEDKKTLGGHLLEAKVGVTSETVLLSLDIPMERVYNKEKGTMDLELP